MASRCDQVSEPLNAGMENLLTPDVIAVDAGPLAPLRRFGRSLVRSVPGSFVGNHPICRAADNVSV